MENSSRAKTIETTGTPEFMGGYPVVAPPVPFSFARWLIRENISGGWRLWSFLRRRGYLDVVADHHLVGPVRDTVLYTPLFRPESSMSERDIDLYETLVIDTVSHAAKMTGGKTTLIDCGADIGMVSSALIRRCEGLTNVFALEPNTRSFEFLEQSAAKWPVETITINKGVGATSMTGRLERSSIDASDHACYLVEDENGDIEVIDIDSLAIASLDTIILKIDVEGGEREVLLGARKTLSAANRFIVVFEAHLRVFERTGVDAVEIIKQIEEIARVDVKIVEAPDVTFDRSRPFFEQVSSYDRLCFNLVCVSHA